ncbi:hypothetical protein HELRODRAFT_124831, partial [Helobdella robusta]|uniref:Calcipressin n=1 Tax=Helobdella robusta TaxID=6412 RepID=T1EH31_HELRO
DEDFPKSLIVTGIPSVVYESQNVKNEFESLFTSLSSSTTFEYLKSFSRARVTVDNISTATSLRIYLHGRQFHGSTLNCFFAQPSEMTSSTTHLELPKPYKQFLISPPSSPPLGWEHCLEKEPTINYDLISAINNLAPGASHELHPPSPTSPGIVVHICEDPEGFKGQKIAKSKCP